MENYDICTYFCATGFANITQTEQFADVLSLDKQDYKVTQKRDGTLSVNIGTNTDFDIDVNNMAQVTLSKLHDKEESLVLLQQLFDLEYYLERVVHLHIGGVKPILSLNWDTLLFLYKSHTQDDLDYYVIDK